MMENKSLWNQSFVNHFGEIKLRQYAEKKNTIPVVVVGDIINH